MREKMFCILMFGLFLGVPLYAMEAVNETNKNKVDSIILLSKDNKEFDVNEEAINNSEFLLRNKNCCNKKIPLEYSSEVVEFVTQVLNNPLDRELLIRKLIVELQNQENRSGQSLCDYTRALKEFGVSVKSVVDEMEAVNKPTNMVMKNDHATVNTGNNTEFQIQERREVRAAQQEAVFTIEQSCCRNWQCCPQAQDRCSLGDLCSFSVLKLFKKRKFCIPPFVCQEDNGNCYIVLPGGPGVGM